MSIEIERKFLPSEQFNLQEFSTCVQIKQGFICADQDKAVRVRIKGDQSYLTVKGPSEENGLSRYEYETRIPVTDALEMMKLCYQPIIEKTRYLLPHEDLLFEIDVFEGENQGLIIIELELKEKNQKVELPEFVGPEVTGDPKYYNAYLAKNPYKGW